MKLCHSCTDPCVKSPAGAVGAGTLDAMGDAVRCVTDLLTVQGLICLDFADIQTVLEGGGCAVFVSGEASGPDRARLAVDEVIRKLKAAFSGNWH